MTKQRVIEQMRASGYSAGDAERAVAAVSKAIVDVAKADGRVALPNFGIFKVKTRAERTSRNPQTGEAIKVAAKQALTFKASTGVV